MYAPLALTLVLLGVWFIAGLEQLFASAAAGFGWHLRNFGEPIRGATRLLLKEFRPTERPDRLLWLGAPLILLGAVMAALSVMPLSGAHPGANLGIGVVFFTAMIALVSLAAYVAGWAPNSKFPLMAGYRYVGLVLAYELPLVLTVAAAALPAESLRLADIVATQQAGLWNALLQPLGLLIYLFAGMAMAFWGPFRLVESADVAGGLRLELGGAPLLIWRLGHYALVLAVAAFSVPLFLGGGHGPWLPAALWTLLKTVLMLVVLTALPYALPRARLESLMRGAWKWLVPVAVANLLLVAAVLQLRPDLAPAGG